MKKAVLFLAALFVLSLVFEISIASASKDVAYVYRKSFKIDDNVISLFEDMGFSVDMIKESEISGTDFSEYNLIFVGDEIFSDASKIPVTHYPSIISNYNYGYEFGLTDQDGVSMLASTAPLNVKIDDEIIQVYTQAFYKPLERIAIPYYYISDLNKAPGLRKVAATYMGDSYDLGSVIAYADAHSQLNGKYTQGKLCFFGIIESDFWTPSARQMFKDCIGFVSIACYTDEDCEDNNPDNIDKCINPGTVDSYCDHYGIACFTDEDCGADGWVGEPHCIGNDLYQDYKEFTCNDPGTNDASCSYDIEEKLKQTCPKGCADGRCIDAHDIGIKVYGDYIDGIKITNDATQEIIVTEPASVEGGEKYKLQFKIMNLGSFDEEIEYTVSILEGSSVVYEFSPGTTTLDAGETSTDRTRTWNVELPNGDYDIKISVDIIGFVDDNPSDNIKYRRVVIGGPVGECQDILEIKPGINYVSLKCKYQCSNDVQSLFEDKMGGGTSMASGDNIWTLVPGEYPNDKKFGVNYDGIFQVDFTGAGALQGKWFDPDTGAISTLEFEPGDGFLIENRHDERTITLNGEEPGSITYNFVKGYNMFGVADEMKASEFLALVPECFAVSIWQPDQEYWDEYSAGYALPDSKYWIYYPESSKYSTAYNQDYDINSDGKVNSLDALSIAACYYGKCDVNKDGGVDPMDFIAVLENVGCSHQSKIQKYDIDGSGCIDDYDAMAILAFLNGYCDLNNDGKVNEADRDLIFLNQQYNIVDFNLEVNTGYMVQCNQAVTLVL